MKITLNPFIESCPHRPHLARPTKIMGSLERIEGTLKHATTLNGRQSPNVGNQTTPSWNKPIPPGWNEWNEDAPTGFMVLRIPPILRTLYNVQRRGFRHEIRQYPTSFCSARISPPSVDLMDLMCHAISRPTPQVLHEMRQISFSPLTSSPEGSCRRVRG